MPEIDLDQMRAARAESETPAAAHVVVFGGERFEVPAKPDASLFEGLAEFAYLLREGQRGDNLAKAAAFRPLYRAFETFLGPEQWARFSAMRPELDDILNLVNGLTELWNLGELGNSSASGSPSAGDGQTSRQPSQPTTA